MFCWFIGTAVVAVGFVFRDPRFDYRLLIVGSVLPLLDLVIEPVTGVLPLHSITVSVALLVVVMLATIGRRRLRRLLLGLPIGMFLHLVFDGAWSDTDVFWWPITGWEVADAELPLVQRGALSLVLEVVGIALCVWIARANGFGSAAARRRFLHDGHLAVVPLAR